MSEDPARNPRQTILLQDVTDPFDESRLGRAGTT
jgi:hypothetical protein